MATVYVKDNESFDSAFRRWKRKCANEGIVTDLKRHVEYKKPSIKRKEKMENARKQRKN
ncbi:MAG: 30S ribosomal protein S21 [Clostridia bacterium]|nr:30S ribosomal protein S21 [Clostridia bacterium]